MRGVVAVLGFALLAAGCQQPTVEVAGKASLGVDKPIEVRLEGLAIEFEGTFVTPELFGQIKQDQSVEYVAAIIGAPDYETKLGDGTLIWRWKYRPKSQQIPLFNFFGQSDNKEPRPDHITTIVVFRDNKVQT
ncbi:MAG TPA: hypothetical protein VGB55_08010, partial [Tepidisphaeraceae bacterium]